MEKLFVISILISIVYAIVTVVESKFIQKKIKPTKEIIREGFFVFISSLVSLFLFFKMSGTLTEFFKINLKSTIPILSVSKFCDVNII